MLRRLYDWTMNLSAQPHAIWALAAVAFAESSFFPIPPDILIIPMVLATRERAWRIALVSTVASVVGGFAGYGIGHFLFEAVGRPLFDFYGYTAQFSQFQDYYHQWGAWIVAGAGLTPFPYKVITIASGVVSLDPTTFGIASLLSRGARFFAVAALLWYYGAPVRVFLEKNLNLLATAFFVLLLGGFVVVRYVL